MPELTELLDLAARPAGDPTVVDAAGDLRRGRRALSRVRRRRTAAGLVCAAGGVVVATIGLTGGTAPEPRRDGASEESSDTTADAPPPRAERVTVGPFSFARPPGGWRVNGLIDSGNGVTLLPPADQIDPDGGMAYADRDPNNLHGKITITLQAVPMVTEPSGEEVQHDGRTFGIRPGDFYEYVSVTPVPGDAQGFIYVAFWNTARLDRATRLAFVDSIRVEPGTVPLP